MVKVDTVEPRLADAMSLLPAGASGHFINGTFASGPAGWSVLTTADGQPLADVAGPLAICAVNFTHGRPEIFRSKGLAGAAASPVSLLDAVRASAAAPTYVPPRRIAGFASQVLVLGAMGNDGEVHLLTPDPACPEGWRIG